MASRVRSLENAANTTGLFRSHSPNSIPIVTGRVLFKVLTTFDINLSQGILPVQRQYLFKNGNGVIPLALSVFLNTVFKVAYHFYQLFGQLSINITRHRRFYPLLGADVFKQEHSTHGFAFFVNHWHAQNRTGEKAGGFIKRRIKTQIGISVGNIDGVVRGKYRTGNAQVVRKMNFDGVEPLPDLRP
jgi:hypothetical protein